MTGKDMTLKVKYARTDSGCLQVFIEKDGKHYASLTVFPKDGIMLNLPESNTDKVTVYPDNALHREWFQEVCSLCGWKSEPYEGHAFGAGGILDCPECRKAKRDDGIRLEMCYGNVHEIELDWKTKQPKKKEEKQDVPPKKA